MAKKKFRRPTEEVLASNKFNRSVREQFRDYSGFIEEESFLTSRSVIRYRDAKGHLRSVPKNGRKPKGWKREKVTYYFDVQGKPVKKPLDPARVSNRFFKFKEKGSRTWKLEENTDFRKPVKVALFEQTGDGTKIIKEFSTQDLLLTRKEKEKLEKSEYIAWNKSRLSQVRKHLFPAIQVGEKFELFLEGRSVREALNSYQWEIARWGQEVHITGTCKYKYTDSEGKRQSYKFPINMVEDWRSAPNIGNGETFGSILANSLGNTIRKGFADQHTRFTTLDFLAELYDKGMLSEELFQELEEREQAESVFLYLLIKIRDRKLEKKIAAAKKVRKRK